MREVLFRLEAERPGHLESQAETLPIRITAPTLEELQHEARAFQRRLRAPDKLTAGGGPSSPASIFAQEPERFVPPELETASPLRPSLRLEPCLRQIWGRPASADLQLRASTRSGQPSLDSPVTGVITLEGSRSHWLPMAITTLDAVRLYRMDLPEHPCPWGLRAVRLLQERHIPFEDHRLTSSEAVDAFKATHGVTTTPQVFAGQERIGGYTDLAARLGVRPETAAISYAPMVAVFVTAGLMASVLSAGVSGFMGMSICLLAMLKLMDLEAFAASFRKYDLLSQSWRSWGRLYPGVELLVGLGMLLRPERSAATQLVGAVAVLLGAMGMVSVGKAVFIDHLALNCACVGGNSKTPLGPVSFAENLIMAAMGAAMLAGR